MGLVRHKFSVVVLCLVFITGLSLEVGARVAFAQSEPISQTEFGLLKGDLEHIKTELADVKKELQLIRQLLSRRPPQARQPARVEARVSVAGNPAMGQPDAPVTLIEFSDYQCPFCRRFSQTTLPTLKAEYIDTGKLRYVFRDFPLDQIHPYARKAAEAAHCAGDQGKYWAMHDLLFQKSPAFQVKKLKKYARRLDLDPRVFDGCLEQDKYRAKVQKNYEDGGSAGVRGTPGFFVGKTRSDDTIQGVLISGARPLPVFRQAIEGLLREN